MALPHYTFLGIACTVHCRFCPELSSHANAGNEHNWSTFKRVWSDDRNRLLVGRVALLVYCHYNQRVLDRGYKSCMDWDSFIHALELEEPIRAPKGHAALAVPGASSLTQLLLGAQNSSNIASDLPPHAGVEPVADGEEGMLENDKDESGQENVTPTSDGIDAAVAAEEAMMEMTTTGTYQALL